MARAAAMRYTDEGHGLLLRPLAVSEDTLRRLAYNDPEHFPVLLDSAAVGPAGRSLGRPLGRYSILAAYPQSSLWLDARGVVHASGHDICVAGGFLRSLEATWRRE